MAINSGDRGLNSGAPLGDVLSGRKFDIAFLLSSRFAIAIDLLILWWHFLCGFVPTVRRPYAADDCLCPLIDVNMLDADMLVAAVPEATEGLHLP